MPLEYFNVPKKLFNIEDAADCFFVKVDGNGMKKAGINSKDLLLFKKTSTPTDGSIVMVEVDGQTMCRRYIKKGSDIILRREGRPTTEIVVKTCNVQGELVSLVRNFG